MKTRTIVAFSLTVLLAVTFGLAQSRNVRAKIPFEFTVAGKVFPAGEYTFTYDARLRRVAVSDSDKRSVDYVSIVTFLAAAMHTTPDDSHVVFDKIGNKHYLSELWIPGMDGLDLLSTKEKHEHEIVNVPR